MRKLLIALILCLFLYPFSAFTQDLPEECTVGIASGSVTVDGRPLLWKNRDTNALHNEVTYFTDGRFKYLALTTAGYSRHAWAGVNEMGFCIMNSASSDLAGHSETGLDNGEIMKVALQTCVTVDDFEQYLINTNISGRHTAANFGAIDAFGGAVFFETGNYSYTRFDVNDPNIAPHGYIVRANFADTGGGAGGKIRFERGDKLWKEAALRNKLDYKFVLRHTARDMADENAKPYSIPVKGKIGENPRGTINTYATLNRWATASVAVFHGVRPDENPSLTTFWAILGEPIFSVAVPNWILAEGTAGILDGEKRSPLCSAVLDIKKKCYYDFGRKQQFIKTEFLPAIWEVTFAAEDKIFEQTDAMVAQWRENYPKSEDVTAFHNRMAAEAFGAIEKVQLDMNEKVKPIRVAVYADFGAADKCVLETIAALEIDPEIETGIVKGADIVAHALDNFDVIVFPGGSASKESASLGDMGRKIVRDFVRSGGGYVGICAGAYLGSDHPDYPWRLGVADAHVIDRQHYSRGKSLVNIELTKAGSKFLKEYGKKNIIQCYYANGPLLTPGDNPEIDDYEALGISKSDVHITGNAPEGIMPGTTFLLRSNFGKGRSILCAGHPESTPGARWFVPRMVRWVAKAEAFEYSPVLVKPNHFTDEIIFEAEWSKKESTLLRKLNAPDKAERLAAMNELTAMGSRDFFQWLPGRLRDDDPEIRKLAATLILKLDHLLGLPELEAALEAEKDGAVKKVMQDVWDKLQSAMPNNQ